MVAAPRGPSVTRAPDGSTYDQQVPHRRGALREKRGIATQPCCPGACLCLRVPTRLPAETIFTQPADHAKPWRVREARRRRAPRTPRSAPLATRDTPRWRRVGTPRVGVGRLDAAPLLHRRVGLCHLRRPPALAGDHRRPGHGHEDPRTPQSAHRAAGPDPCASTARARRVGLPLTPAAPQPAGRLTSAPAGRARRAAPCRRV